ncbi:MAG: SPOR domain-containing protein [Thermoanaerobaculum sp.]|nr:SPOR domain-containing protein [Thermoanaerobaculum sp.]
MARYYQLVVSGRQIVVFALALAAVLVVVFTLGVGVGLMEREHRRQAEGQPTLQVAFAATPATTVVPSPPNPVVEPEVPPTPTPEPSPIPTAVLPPTLTPAPAKVASQEGEGVRGVWVQVAALRSRSDAEGVRHRVLALGFRPEQVRVLPLASGKYRVRLGPFPDRESGLRVVARVQREGFPEAFLVGP